MTSDGLPHQVREMLVELKAIETPPRYSPKVAREIEARRDLLADKLRRSASLEAQYEHLAKFRAQMLGAVDLLQAADAFEYRRQKHSVQGEYSRQGLHSMVALRAESELRKMRDGARKNEAMSAYLDHELPALERVARERVEASATLHLTMPVDAMADDESLQQGLQEDLEDLCGLNPVFDGAGKKQAGSAAARFVFKEVQAASKHGGMQTSRVTMGILEGPGRPVEEIMQMLRDGDRGGAHPATFRRCSKILSEAPQHMALRIENPKLHLVELLSVSTAPATIIVHDARTLFDRRAELEADLKAARAALRPLQAKEMVATAAQAQLWKLEGVEEALSQCQNPRLIELKERERAARPRLLQLAAGSEAAIEEFKEQQQAVLRLEAKVECLSRLIEGAKAEAEGAPAPAPAPTVSEETLSLADEKAKERELRYQQWRGYSFNVSREVTQTLLRERRQHDQRMRAFEATAPKVSSKATAQRKYVCQGTLQVLKKLRQADKAAHPSQVPAWAPSVSLVAYHRHMKRDETFQMEAIKLMAREAARVLSSCTQPGAAKGGYWNQMKATIQMSPPLVLFDETIFDETLLQRAAAEMGVDLSVSEGDGPETTGLGALPFVIHFLRAPLPYPFREIPTDHFGAGAKGAAKGAASARSRRYITGAPKPAEPPNTAPKPIAGLSGAPTAAPVKGSTGGAVVGASPVPPSLNRQASTLVTAPVPIPTPPQALRFENVLSGEKVELHPMRHVYARLAKRAEKLTLKRRQPDDTSPEAWMEFVEPGSGIIYYYCFLAGSQRREYEFPKVLPVGVANSLTVKTTKEMQSERLRRRMVQKMRNLTPGALEAMRINLEAETKSKPRRAAFLSKMPLPVGRIVATAQYLGIDPLSQAHLMWIASAALCDYHSPTLAIGWERRKSRDPKATLPHYYFNMTLGTVQWEHPAFTQWRSVLHELLAAERTAIGMDAHNASLEAIAKPDPRNPKPMLWVTETQVWPQTQ